MNKISRKISSWRDYLILLSAMFCAFYLIFFVNEPRRLGPVQRLGLEIVGRLTAPSVSIRQLLRLRQENQRLRYQNTLLQLKNAQLAEAFYENSRLRQMLNFSLGADLPLVPAKVIGNSGKTGPTGMVINVGTDQGIEVNMTVVSPDGLVGRITAVSINYAVVQTIADAGFRAAALVQRSRVQGIFQWAGYDYGTMKGVYLTADVRVGDIIITSGLNSMFVSGLKIGTVTFVDDASTGLFKKIDIKSRADFSKMEEVFVIKKTPTTIAVVP